MTATTSFILPARSELIRGQEPRRCQPLPRGLPVKKSRGHLRKSTAPSTTAHQEIFLHALDDAGASPPPTPTQRVLRNMLWAIKSTNHHTTNTPGDVSITVAARNRLLGDERMVADQRHDPVSKQAARPAPFLLNWAALTELSTCPCHSTWPSIFSWLSGRPAGTR